MKPDDLPERWALICRIASMALDCEAQDEDALLERECGCDQDLRQSVLDIVGHYSESDDLLGIETPQLSLLQTHEFRSGESIGAYRIERKIGEGGMGRVYFASRADDAFTKEVAIKVNSLPSPTLEAQFRAERSILAQMEHAGIARLLDAGTTAVVMEYVDGMPVDAYCEAHKLDTRQRLKLFDRIFEAISYAHHRGVLHCDLKPSNVYVNRDGEPRLLDFGLAKAGGAVPEGLIAFTPTYASPELVQEKAVGPFSDVYSLGVMPQRLLRGPVAPDLKGILAKAGDPDSARRYQTVNELAEDLLRFRRNFPVQAREQTPGYVAGKFIKRNLLEIVAAALFVLAVVQFAKEWRNEGLVSSAKSVERITKMPGRETFPSISPDGKQVAFASLAEGHWDIYVRSEGGALRNLTAGSGVDNTEPALSPDGTQIAFRSTRDGGGLFVLSTVGGTVRKISSPTARRRFRLDVFLLPALTGEVTCLRSTLLQG